MQLLVNVPPNTDQTSETSWTSRTVVGLDVNEDNMALTAVSAEGVDDTLVINFPEIKFDRHCPYKMRNRVQNAGKDHVQRPA